MTEFFIVRHCQAKENIKMIFQGTLDGEVSELGEKQLYYLGERFKSQRIDRIYSSSRKRALATAKAVNKYHNLDIIIDDRLAEIDGGDWEGKKFSEFDKLFPVSFKMWNEAPYDFIAPNGESMRSVYDRVSSFVKQTAKSAPGETIVLASHGCAVRNLICWAKYGDLHKIGNLPWPANTAVYRICVDEKGDVQVLSENDISHLPDEIKTLSAQKWSKTEG